MKRYLAFMGSGMFCVVCFSLYLMLESTTLRDTGIDENDLNGIEVKIKQIEVDLQKNHRTIQLIKKAVQDIAKGDSEGLQRLHDAIQNLQDSPPRFPLGRGITEGPGYKGGVAAVRHVNVTGLHKATITIPGETCSLADSPPSKTDIQMGGVFETLPFDNPDGGVWKQGYPISYNMDSFRDKPLKVFVIPHSHCDPGWLKTFERYYMDQTRHVLDNMVDKLEQYPEMKFIYAEMSFFSMWWGEIEPAKKARVKRLIEKGQLELVTGGWVMSDEANAHYFAMLDQLIEGNTWLQNQLDYTPKSGWAIDPFGHSPTMAYLLKRSGFHSMLIQRTHYAIKKYLSKSKSLEFMWRQLWDHEDSTDMFCHMMPFYSYDTPHSCGPDPKICCQFDFKRLPGGRVTCPWKIPPVPINDANVAQRAEMLADQYRKKSQLYKNNIILIPLGDDFRYDKTIEWDQQYLNYKRLFDYMNNQPSWKIQAQFGTLSDFFSALHQRDGSETWNKMNDYPSLSGDFFSYADREDNYWSGYFTSRPFYKRLDRILEDHLRGGEILFSLAVAYARHERVTEFPDSLLMRHVVGARRALGLFQHHDGITGTGKDFVMADYGNKMLKAINSMKEVIKRSGEFLATKDKSAYQYAENSPMFDIDEDRQSYDSLPFKKVILVDEQGRPFLLYNSLHHTRKQVARIYVNYPHVEVRDAEGNPVLTQIDPYWEGGETISSIVYKCSFVATIPAFGLSKFTVHKKNSASNENNFFPTVTFYNSEGSQGHWTTSKLRINTVNNFEEKVKNKEPFAVKRSKENNFSIENADLQVSFSTTSGTMKEIIFKDSKKTVQADVEFMWYGTKVSKEKSGAYLFLPNGHAQSMGYSPPLIRVIQGPVVSEVHSMLPSVQHTVRVFNSPGLDGLGIEVANLVDIKQATNKELAMRIRTDIQSNEFYTDLNGFQMIRRVTYEKLTLQGNFYPMPTAAFIEDQNMRFSVYNAQSLGVASLKSGWLEIIQDRRLNQDDGRGLGQGVLDNKRTPNKFTFLFESKSNAKISTPQPGGYHSMMGHLMALNLNHPIHVLPPFGSTRDSSSILGQVQPLKKDLPCELHLVNLRLMQNKESSDQEFVPRKETALLLHRLGVDCKFPTKGLLCSPGDGQVILSNIFENVSIRDATASMLSMVRELEKVELLSPITIPPMEIRAYKVDIS